MARKRLQHPDYVTCKHCHRDFRAINVPHLRNIHGYEGDHPVQDYKRRFRLSIASCRDVRKKNSVAKDEFWAKRGQHWTPSKLLAEVRARHRAGGSLRSKKIPVRLYEASRRLFGSWPLAIEKAGLKYQGPAVGVKRWTQERIVQAILELAKRGAPLTATYVKAKQSALLRAATRWFPFSWTKALRAAGLDPREHQVSRCRWNRQDAES